MSRMVTGLIVGVVFGGLWWVQGPVLRVALLLLTCLSVWEMYNALSTKGMRPARWVGMLYAVLAMPVYLLGGSVLLTPLTTVCCVLGLATVLFRGEADFESAVGTLFPILYPGLMFTMIYPLQDLSAPMISTLAMGLTFIIAFVSDIFAYEIGSRWGRHKLAPKLSPKKTIEGALAGLAGAVIVSVLVPLIFQVVCGQVPAAQPYAVPLPPLWQFALLGLLAGVASEVGDLAASMIKRYCGIKDFGTLLPGHGGVMDRIDSVLFNGVVVYMFFLLVVK